MAFPSVVQHHTTYLESRWEHTPEMPSGMTAGNLIVVLSSIDRGAEWSMLSSSTGWTFLGQARQSQQSLAVTVGIVGEVGTLTLSGSTFDPSGHIVIEVADATSSPAEVLAAFTTGSSTSPAPPNLNTGSAADRLWLGVASRGWAGFGATSGPSGYSGFFSFDAGSASGTNTAYAWRNLSVASETPGTFSTNRNDGWSTATIAIPSGAAPAVPIGVDGARAATRATRPLLVQRYSIDVDGARATTRATRPALAQSTDIAVRAARSSAQASSPLLAQASAVALRAARAASTASVALLAQHLGALSIAAARSASQGTSPALQQSTPLGVVDGRAATAASAVSLSARTTIVVREARVETAATRAPLSAPGVLIVQSAHAVAAATAPLLAQRQTIGAESARSGTGADRALLEQRSPLLVSPARAATAATRPLFVAEFAVLDARATTRAQRVLLKVPSGEAVRVPTSVRLREAFGLVVHDAAPVTAGASTVRGTVTVAATEGSALVEAASGAVAHAAELYTVRSEAEGLVHVTAARGVVLETP